MTFSYDNKWLLTPIPADVPTPICAWCWPKGILASHYDYRGYPVCTCCGRLALHNDPSMPTFAMVLQ